MKSFTSHVTQERYAAEQKVVWLLRVVIGGQPWRAASEAIDFDGESYPARLAIEPDWGMKSARPFGAGGLIETAAEARLNDPPGAADSFEDRIAEDNPLGAAVTLKLLWVDDPATWAPADAVTMLSGVITDYGREPGIVILEMRDLLGSLAERRTGRSLTSEMVSGEHTQLLGSPLPLVFGRHDALPLGQLRAGRTTRLTAPLGPGDAVAHVGSLEGFPETGSVQIGREILIYAAIDPLALTLGTAQSPIQRGDDVSLHSTGSQARLVPSSGFQWLVADHPCASVDAVFADEVILDASEWTAQSRALGPIQAQVVTMAAWPVIDRFAATTRNDPARTLFDPSVYTVAAENSATDPQLAHDDQPTSTAALLNSTAPKLALEISSVVGSDGPSAGRYAGASIRVRYSASRRWGPGARVTVRFKQGSALLEAAIPRPSEAETQGELHAEPGEAPAMVATPVGLHEFELDLAPAIDSQTGWSAFDAAPPTQMQVEFVDADLGTDILIHDLELRLIHFARTTPAQASRLTARVSGWPDGQGAVIENPADIIRVLLTDERFAGLNVNAIDGAGLAAIGTSLAAKGFAYARVVGGNARLADLIDAAAREAAIWILAGAATVGFRRATVSPRQIDSVESLDAEKALEPRAPVSLEHTRMARSIDCLKLVAPGPLGATAPTVWTRCAVDAMAATDVADVQTLRWLDGREIGALGSLGERLWSRVREPAVRYTQAYPIGAAMLEPGDTVESDLASLSISNVFGAVEQVRSAGPARVEVIARMPHAGDACWSADAGTFIRRMGFGQRLVVSLGGVPIAALEAGGRLRLAGRLREEAGFAAGPFATALAASGGFIYASTGSGGLFTPWLRLDGAGNADVNGIVREQSNRAFLIDGNCMTANAALFRLSADPQAAGLEFDLAGGRVHLAGIVSESNEL